MKTLESEFRKGPWFHRLLKRTPHKALYERWKETSAAPHYEVIKILIKDPKDVKMGENIAHYEGGEHYPGDNEFRVLGWSYQDLAHAERKYDSLPDPEAKKKHGRPTKKS